MPTSKTRYMITVTDEMANAIEDFRFSNRYGDRSKALIYLLQIGLEHATATPEQTVQPAEDEIK
jgi:hypothetical protein